MTAFHNTELPRLAGSSFIHSLIAQTAEGMFTSLEDKNVDETSRLGKKILAFTNIQLAEEQNLDGLASTSIKLAELRQRCKSLIYQKSIENHDDELKLVKLLIKLNKTSKKVGTKREILQHRQSLYSSQSSGATSSSCISETKTMDIVKFFNLEVPQSLDPEFSKILKKIDLLHAQRQHSGKCRYALQEICEITIKLKEFLDSPDEPTRNLAIKLQSHLEALQTEITDTIQRNRILISNLEAEYAGFLEGLNFQTQDSATFYKIPESVTDLLPQSFFITLQQIICNPFDPYVQYSGEGKIHEFLNRIDKCSYFPPLFILQNTISSYPPERALSLEQIIELKRMNILKIASSCPEQKGSTSPKLILGAGPCGLVHALKSFQMNQQTILVEQRQIDQLYLRNNTISLGTCHKQDLDILSHFGIIEQLQLEGASTPFALAEGSGMIHTSIGGLEKQLDISLKALNTMALHPKVTKYLGASVTHLDVKEGKSSITIQQKEGAPFVIEDPSEMIIAEGAHSNTRSLLGIESYSIAKTQLAFSGFFHRLKPGAVRASEDVSEAINIELILRNKSLNDAKNELAKVFQSLFFEASTHAHLYAYPSEETKRNLKKIDLDIKHLELKIKRATNSDAAEMAILIEEKLTLLDKRKAIIRKDAVLKRNNWESVTPYLPYTGAIYNGPLEYSHSDLATVGVYSSSTFGGQLGKVTRFLLVGDALQETDPISGSGCSVAISSSKVSLLKNSPFALELYAEHIEIFRNFMIDAAFENRTLFGIERTEFIERFTESEVKNGFLLKSQHELLTRLIIRSKKAKDAPEMRFLTEVEVEALGEIKERIDKVISKTACSLRESELLKKVHCGFPLHSPKRNTARNASSFNKFYNLVGDTPSRFLGVLLGIDHIEQTLTDRR